MMNMYPLFADVRNLPVLVVGGGAVARRKAQSLLAAGADVTLGAPRLDEALAHRVDDGELAWRQGAFEPAWLDGMWLVIAATDDRELNAAVAAAATAHRVFANVVDDAELSRFHVPAVVDRAPLMVAISTAGAAPALARRVRETLERVLDSALGSLIALARKHRTRIVQRRPRLIARRDFYDWLHDGPVLSLLRSGQSRAAEQALMDALHDDAAPAREGSVALVGAGPGHPGLLTLQALRVLHQADVILHDHLASAEVLAMARRDAERIDVGKRCGGRRVPQEQIHQLMLTHVRQGRRVVRLKGGDPFVFGRGGEEVAFMRDHGIACEVVPGITAAMGCAAFAGIPLTHREHAQSLCLLTARGRDGSEALDEHMLGARRQTLVVYMGARRMAALAARILAHGRSAQTPVAIIENGTLPRQCVIAGTLGDLSRLTDAQVIATPALLVIGAVARHARADVRLDARVEPTARKDVA